MPGQRLASFRQGDSAERFAEFLLGTFAFTTGVPRQEDVGHDFHCVLSEPNANGVTLHAGPSFSVQVKSSNKPIVYDQPAAVRWIWEQDNPLFICTINKSRLSCEIFATWNLINAVLLHPPQPIALLPNAPIDYDTPTPVDVGKKLVSVPLGPPVVMFSAKDAVATEWPAKCARVMRPWIELDRGNIVRRRANVYAVLAPSSWTPNETYIGNAESFRQWFYWNPNNLGDSIRNLVLACEAFGRVVRANPELPDHQDWTGRLAAVDSVLREFGRL